MPATKSKKPHRACWGKKAAESRSVSAAKVASVREPAVAAKAAPALPPNVDAAEVKAALAAAAARGNALDPAKTAAVEAMVHRSQVDAVEREHQRLKSQLAMLKRVLADEERDALDRAICERFNAKLGRPRGSWQKPSRAAEPTSALEASRAHVSALGKIAKRVKIRGGLAVA